MSRLPGAGVYGSIGSIDLGGADRSELHLEVLFRGKSSDVPDHSR